MDQSDYLLGHRPMEQRINVRKRLARYREDPLFEFIDSVSGYHRLRIIEDDISMYQLAYSWYYLCLQRFLPEMSLSVRWGKGPYWALKEGRRYTPYEAKIAERYNQVAPYLYLDFYSCLLYARILLDRVAALSRSFLQEGDRPSFTSFNDHKRFFAKRATPYGSNEEYASYIRDSTSWFDMPLKYVRDHFIVHSSPKHMRIFGYPMGDNELSLILSVPLNSTGDKPLPRVKHISVSIPRLAEEIHEFLSWFNRYAVQAVNRT
jgi:hypothetical protein